MRRYRLPAFIWTAIVTLLTLLPGRDMPEIHIINFDKFAHLGVFGLLNLLYLRWQRFGRPEGISSGIVTVLVISYSGLIEFLQGAFYTDRYADPYDFAANATGCLLAWLMFPLLPKALR
jgi:VanZ family protein